MDIPCLVRARLVMHGCEQARQAASGKKGSIRKARRIKKFATSATTRYRTPRAALATASQQTSDLWRNASQRSTEIGRAAAMTASSSSSERRRRGDIGGVAGASFFQPSRPSNFSPWAARTALPQFERERFEAIISPERPHV